MDSSGSCWTLLFYFRLRQSKEESTSFIFLLSLLVGIIRSQPKTSETPVRNQIPVLCISQPFPWKRMTKWWKSSFFNVFLPPHRSFSSAAAAPHDGFLPELFSLRTLPSGGEQLRPGGLVQVRPDRRSWCHWAALSRGSGLILPLPLLCFQPGGSPQPRRHGGQSEACSDVQRCVWFVFLL